MAMNIENHVVIISGGGGDIGSTIVKGFVEEKCRIVLCDVNIDASNAVKERFPEAEIETCKVDITNEVSVAELADNVMKKYGHIDSLLNVAGILCRKSVFETEKSDFEKSMAFCKASLLSRLSITSPPLTLGRRAISLSIACFRAVWPAPSFWKMKLQIVSFSSSSALRMCRGSICCCPDAFVSSIAF